MASSKIFLFWKTIAFQRKIIGKAFSIYIFYGTNLISGGLIGFVWSNVKCMDSFEYSCYMLLLYKVRCFASKWEYFSDMKRVLKNNFVSYILIFIAFIKISVFFWLIKTMLLHLLDDVIILLSLCNM